MIFPPQRVAKAILTAKTEILPCPSLLKSRKQTHFICPFYNMDLFPFKMSIIDMTYYKACYMWIDIQRNKTFKVKACFVRTHIST